jgi:hypothetical protein
MRALIALGIFVVVVLAFLVLTWALDRFDGRRRGVTDSELRRLAQQMARQLDLGLADPMLRQSSAWEATAKSLVDKFYGRTS